MGPTGVGEWPSVYFIEAIGCGLIKIGYTERVVEVRLRQLRPMSPVPLRVLGVIEGGEDLERELHLRFRDLWSHGEWFRATEELTAYIAEVALRWEEPKAGFKRHLIAKCRLPDGSMPPTVEQQLKAWAASTRLTYGGQTRTVAEWAKIKDKSLQTLKRRIDGGAIPENLFGWHDNFSKEPGGWSPVPVPQGGRRPKKKPPAAPTVQAPAEPEPETLAPANDRSGLSPEAKRAREARYRRDVDSLVGAIQSERPKRYAPLQVMLDAARKETP